MEQRAMEQRAMEQRATEREMAAEEMAAEEMAAEEMAAEETAAAELLAVAESQQAAELAAAELAAAVVMHPEAAVESAMSMNVCPISTASEGQTRSAPLRESWILDIPNRECQKGRGAGGSPLAERQGESGVMAVLFRCAT